MKSLHKGTLAILAATVLYGSVGILARIAGFSIPIFYLGWTRMLLAAALTGLLLLTTRRWKALAREAWGPILIRALAGVAAFLFFFISVNNIPIGTAYFIFYGGSTIVGYAFGHTWLNERLNKVKVVAFIISILGLSLIFSISIESLSPFYLLLAVAAGATTAIWNVMSKKIPNTYGPIQLAFIDNSLSFLFYMVVSLLLGELWPMPTLSPVWMANFLIGTFFFATGLLVVYGFRKLGAQLGSIIMLAEVVFAVFFSFLFYKEIPTTSAIIGGVLIIAAVALPELPKKYLPFLHEK